MAKYITIKKALALIISSHGWPTPPKCTKRHRSWALHREHATSGNKYQSTHLTQRHNETAADLCTKDIQLTGHYSWFRVPRATSTCLPRCV